MFYRNSEDLILIDILETFDDVKNNLGKTFLKVFM